MYWGCAAPFCTMSRMLLITYSCKKSRSLIASYPYWLLSAFVVLSATDVCLLVNQDIIANLELEQHLMCSTRPLHSTQSESIYPSSFTSLSETYMARLCPALCAYFSKGIQPQWAIRGLFWGSVLSKRKRSFLPHKALAIKHQGKVTKASNVLMKADLVLILSSPD